MSYSLEAHAPLYGPFAETTPSGQTGWIDERRRPIREHIAALLSTLDAHEKYTYSMWRGTDPTSIVVTSQDASETFIQAAGSAEQLTIEVRLLDEQGTPHLYTIGKKQPLEEATFIVPTSTQSSVLVFSNELFTPEEATAIFETYYRTEHVDSSHTLREILA